jgi:uncharacterized protein
MTRAGRHNTGMDPTSTASLNADERQQLQAFLLTLPAGAMSIEELDGFFCGLQTSPDLVTSEVWLPLIWGQDAHDQASFDNAEQAQTILRWVMRHWKAVAGDLLRGLTQPDQPYLPLLLGVPGDADHASRWAAGYVRAMRLSPDGWDQLLNDADNAGALAPVLWLAHEHDDDPAWRGEPLSAQQRAELVDELAAGAGHAYACLEPLRRERANAARQGATFRRSGAKPGRNDPCPCGSGRKYKQCCARTA